MKLLLFFLKRNLLRIYSEFLILIKHKFNFYMIRLLGENPDKIHFGCGDIRLNNFTNVDIKKTPATDRVLDLRRTLPYKSNSVSLIFSEHVFEHFEAWELENIFKESHRILKKGGVLLFSVPHYEELMKALLNPKESKIIDLYCKDLSRFGVEFKQKDKGLKKSLLLNWLIYQGGDHKFVYTYDLLNSLLLKNGFKKIKQRKFDKKLDSYDRQNLSLFVEAEK